MSTQTERLVATLDGDSAGLQASLKAAAKDANGLDSALGSVGKSAKAEMAAGLEQATAKIDAVAVAEERAAGAANRLGQSHQAASAHVGGLGGALNTQSGEVNAASSAMQKYKGVIDGAVTKMGPAGEMVNKVTTLLGPMGLALGGVTAALVGVNLGVGAFNDATTRMLEKTEQGKEILAAIQPEFVSFGKVLEKQFESQRDLIDVGARAQAVNAAWGDVLSGLVAPFTAFGSLLRSVGDAFLGVEERAEALRAQMATLSEQAASAKAFEAYKQGLANLDAGIAAYVNDHQEAVDDIGRGEKLLGDLQVKIANRVSERFSNEATRLDVFQTLLADRQALIRNATEDERDQLLALAEARDKAAEAAQRESTATRTSVAARRGGGGGTAAPAARPEMTAEETQAAILAAQAQRAEETRAAQQQKAFDAQVARKQLESEMTQKSILNMQMEADADTGKKKRMNKNAAEEMQARQELASTMSQYATSFTKSMAAVTIASYKDDKERRKAYRTAVADQIQALGDYAATKAIVSFAEGNFAMGAALAIAAGAAYGTASIMRPSQSPSASAAGAAPAATQAPPQLKTINNTLIVNDAFSDTEQIARRFAQLDRRSVDRGLLPARAGA